MNTFQEADLLGFEAEPVLVAKGKRETERDACIRALIAREATTPAADEARWRALAQYIAILAGRARIDGFDMAGASSPLVQ